MRLNIFKIISVLFKQKTTLKTILYLFQNVFYNDKSAHLVTLSMTLLSLCSVIDGTSFCTISQTNASLIPGLVRSAISKAFFNSSIASLDLLCEVSAARPL